ncbi:membrane progestin receptor alpha-B-like [Mizuhopecten yessoensis]|nr:membrane progestin receptor alpha-B-like [Mizuhopecten yessoensis]XP_021366613.1 membrane progestin receptor alpha-B-like [Mizuhopecten yessoensis]XP_021366614.1 membrane progestin receptor alpha-B-like [Mizuhopecten yessoensis]XP_021366615.1 membrane progestin receptor alpha-B-like [Mizuhopecten yessoensis]
MATVKDTANHVNNFSDYIRTSFSEFLKLQPTLHRDDVDRVLHEPAIVKYYRPTNQPWRYYLISLFQIHNETGNVWTHLIGFIIMWCILGVLSAEYDVWTERHSWPMLVFGLCCVISTMTSTCVHLLHSRSVYHHYSLFMIDYIGATLYSFGSGIQAFYACSDKEMYEYLGRMYLPTLTFVTWLNFVVLCLSKLMFGHNPCDVRRKLMMISMMTVQATIVTLPFGPRYYRCYFSDTCSFSSLNHLTISWIFFVSSAFFFGSHLPEKLFPGKCDIFGQGHQIFHVISVVNQMWQFHSMRLDLSTGASDHTEPDFLVIMAALSVLVLVDTICYVFLKRRIPSVAKEEKQS